MLGRVGWVPPRVTKGELEFAGVCPLYDRVAPGYSRITVTKDLHWRFQPVACQDDFDITALKVIQE